MGKRLLSRSFTPPSVQGKPRDIRQGRRFLRDCLLVGLPVEKQHTFCYNKPWFLAFSLLCTAGADGTQHRAGVGLMTVEQGTVLTDRRAGRNNGLDLLKCIACFGVVFTHITFPGTLGRAIKYASTFAAPSFFMIAGYYSYGCTAEKIKKRLVKITKILVFAIIWWFAYKVVAHIYENTLISWLSDSFTWKTPIWFLAFCTIDWAVPLWYLIAMAETYFMWLYIVKHRSEAKATKLTWLLFILGAALTVLVDSLGWDWSYKINFISRAMPWFMFGYLVNEKYESSLHSIKNISLFVTAIMGWIITLSAAIRKPPVDYNYVGVLLTAPALFLTGIKNRNIRISRPVEYIAEKLSLFIYIFHAPVSFAVSIAAKSAGISKSGAYLYLRPIITLIASIAVAVVFELIFRNRKLRKLIY